MAGHPGVGGQLLRGSNAVTQFGGIDGRLSTLGARARLFTGLNDESLVCPWYTDMGISNQYVHAPIGGGVPAPNVGGTGILRLNSTSIVGGGGQITLPTFASNFGVESMALKRWYKMAIIRNASAALPNAFSRYYVVFSNGAMNGSVAVGFNGTVQTNRYAFSCPNADASTAAPALNVLSGVGPQLGSWVIFEAGFDGWNVYGAVNYETPLIVTAPNNVPNSASTPPFFESRPAAGATQADLIDVDAFGLWAEL